MNTDTVQLQGELTGALIGLARATEGNDHLVRESTDKLILEGLFSTTANAHFDNEILKSLIKKTEEEKKRMVPKCFECASPCGRTENFDMGLLCQEADETRSLKYLILFGIRGAAAYAYHAASLGHFDKEINSFFYRALFAIGMKDWGADELLPILLETGEITLKCMALLEKAEPSHF